MLPIIVAGMQGLLDQETPEPGAINEEVAGQKLA